LTQLVNDIENEIQNINDPAVTKKYIKLVDNKLTFTDEIFDNKWIETLVGNNLQNLPNLLLIDEVTHFSSFEMHLLNEISKYSYNSNSLTFMKIIGAGDPTQLGYLAKVDGDYYNYNVDAINAIFTPRLWSSVRVSNNQKRLNNDRYIRVTRELGKIYNNNKDDYSKSKSESFSYLEATKDLNTLSYFQDSTNIVGERIVNSLDKELVSILAKKINENPKITIGVLTSDGLIPED
jgi:hypothetical protein